MTEPIPGDEQEAEQGTPSPIPDPPDTEPVEEEPNVTDQDTIDAYIKAANAGKAVPGGTIPRSFGGPSQTANDLVDANPDNATDVATVAALYYRGDLAAAEAGIRALKASTTARDLYALSVKAGGSPGPTNPFWDGIPRHDKVLQLQIAAGVKRTELNPGLSLEAAQAIYDANPDGPPTDLS